MAPLVSFRFKAGEATTEVAVGDGAFGLLSSRLPRIAPGRWFVVSSRPVFDLHGETLLRRTPPVDPDPLFLPDGESAKSWIELGKLVSALVSRGLRRDGGVVAFGGGTVGDVAGLAASLALRGVPVVQLPTTLLAASDSALGGKTAVDLPAGKNLAGTFHNPRLVLVEPSVLASLPGRAYRSGLGEVVKCSLLDASFDREMDRLETPLRERRGEAISEAVVRSLKLKAKVVASDPLERKGLRFTLNLGHTVGHALESASGYRMAHGEAVAWGLLAILEVSVERAGLERLIADRIGKRVRTLVDPPPLPRHVGDGWVARLGADKKADRGGLRAVLLRAPGRAVVERVEPSELARGLDAARRRYNGA